MTHDVRPLLEQAGCKQIQETVERSGDKGFKATCPFHKDSSPSFAINGETGLWLCYGCGEKGNLPVFIHRAFGVSMEEAEERYKNVKPWASLPERSSATTEEDVLDERLLISYNLKCPVYMLERGFTKHFLRDFEIGYDEAMSRVVFPVRNTKGALLGLTRRQTYDDGLPKYLHTRFPKSKTLYLGNKLLLTPTRKDIVFITEGHVDALRLYFLDYKVNSALEGVRGFFAGAVAQMGSSLSETQAKLLFYAGYERFVLAYDADSAGDKATAQARELLFTLGARDVYRMSFPGKDPGELQLTDEIGFNKL